MIVLDTHALLWWALDPEQLSAKAKAVCERMERDGGFASSISIWELGVKAKNGKVHLPLSIDDFARRLERSGVVELLPVDTSIWLSSLGLAWDHRDPADRIIVATAQQKGLPILTKDAAMHAFKDAQCQW